MLRRKMFRDIKENKRAYFACSIVIIIGLVAYTAMSISKDNLFIAREEFYQDYAFADVFAQVRAMPYNQLKNLADIEGIDKVQGRLVKDVRVFMPDKDKNIYLRIISFNINEDNPLNKVMLLKGNLPEANKQSILLAEKFFNAHYLNINDRITVIIAGKKEELKIVGTGQSPEYIYALKDGQSIAPDPEAFEVAYMSYDTMETLFKQKGIVNDITFTLKPGYTLNDVKTALSTKLERYGLELLIERKDQISHAMLDQELVSLEKTTQVIPVLFLGIASTILYIMLKRLVEVQRGQIGTLKAFGYSNKEIIFHYLSYGWLVGLLGGIIGGLLGTALSMYFTTIYQMYFSLPNLVGRFSFKYFLLGILLSYFLV